KIDAAHLVVCDVSIINAAVLDHFQEHKGQFGPQLEQAEVEPPRPTPNPNVLIEYGYALKNLGESRVLAVMNTAFGGPELLPFDLRGKRILTYEARPGEPDRSAERSKLVKVLVETVRQIIPELEETPPAKETLADEVTRAIIAVREARPGQ